MRAGCEVEIFTLGNPGDLPSRDGVKFLHLGQGLSAMEFRVDAGRTFHRRHREARFDVLECGEFLAEGVVARHLVADVATVVRIHTTYIK